MATFLTPRFLPQPGDGTFLLLAQGSKKQPHRLRRRKKQPVAKRQPGSVSNIFQQPEALADAPTAAESSPTSAEQTAPAAEDDTGNRCTIAQSRLLSTLQPPLPASPGSAFELGHPSDRHHFTTDHLQDLNSMATTTATMTQYKALPPHLRPRKYPVPPQIQNTSANKPDKVDIVEKLSSMGVSVGEARPADKTATTRWDKDKPATTQGLTSWDEASATPQQETAQQPNSKLVLRPTTTALADPKSALPDSPASDVPPVLKGRGGGGSRERGRGRGLNARSGAATKSREGTWLTRKDFPSVDPKRWESNWDDSPRDDASTLPSEWATHDTRVKKIDPEDPNFAGYQITNWDGGLTPPQLGWESRSEFRPHQSVQLIENWLNRVYSKEEESGEGWMLSTNAVANEKKDLIYSFSTPEDNPHGATIKFMGDLIPIYWMPISIGGVPAQDFWERHLTNNAPEPVEAQDLEGVKPWWELLFKGRKFLSPPSQPTCNGVDPAQETTDQKIRRKLDTGSNTAAERLHKLKQIETANKEYRAKKRAQKAERIIAKTQSSRHSSIPVKKNANIYLAAAQQDDIKEVTEIYNHYVENSCTAPETDRISREEMFERFRECKSNFLPFIVAVERGELIKANHKKRNQHHQQEDVQMPDKIVGFACAADYHDKRSIFRYTATAEVFVRPGYTMKGIAFCLMDKLLAMLDPDYLERRGYETDNELDAVSPKRNIKNIMIMFNYETQKPERLEWMRRWLMDSFGFLRPLVDEDLGVKLGKGVNVATFRRFTGVVLHHADPPPIVNPSSRASSQNSPAQGK